jgi:hypothetical protein
MKKPFDKTIVIQQALKELPSPARRLFLKSAVTLGGLSLLTGCSGQRRDIGRAHADPHIQTQR